MAVTAMDVYKLLPKTNCATCGEASCMAFATKLVDMETDLELCAQLAADEFDKLADLLAPAVREITIGKGAKAMIVGGDEVLYRYELTYYNQTPLVIDIADDMDEAAFDERVKKIEEIQFERTGELLTLDGIALRNRSGDALKFKEAAEKLKSSSRTLVLCSFDADSMKAALEVVGDERPLIYGATENNIEEMAALSLEYSCPIALFVPNDLEKMKELSRTLRAKGITDIVLDPGTYVNTGIGDTLDNFIMIRRLAVEERDEDFRFPIMGVPALTWLNTEEGEVNTAIKEATIATTLINKYADIMIIHGTEIWELIPVLTLRQSIFTDPRKPQAVDAGVYEIGELNEDSPVALTTNFALTYYTVEGDLKSENANSYLLVLDTVGRAVDVAVAGGQFNGKAVADLIKESGIEDIVKTRKMIIPGLAAPISGEIEDDTGWEVVVGPRDSSALTNFLKEKV